MPAQKVAHQGGVTVMKSERSSNNGDHPSGWPSLLIYTYRDRY